MPRILKYPWLFSHRPPFYEIIDDFINLSSLNESNPGYLKNIDIIKQNISESLQEEDIAIFELKNSAKLNCNLNILADVFFQLLNLKTDDGYNLLAAKTIDLCKVLSFFITDKNGFPLNPKTIYEMLKPSNFKKRPNKDDIKRIKIS